LMRCANFVCLLSQGAIRNPVSDRSNFEKLAVDSSCDNVLLEWRLALELKERGMIEGLFPVMIGNKGPDGLYSNYFGSGCHPRAPDTHVESVEHKLREHLDREGLGLPLKESDTVASVLGRVLSNQGGFLEGEFKSAVKTISNTIELMVNLPKDSSRDKLSITQSAPAPRLARVLNSALIHMAAQAAHSTAGQECVRLQFELGVKEMELTGLQQELTQTKIENEEFSQKIVLKDVRIADLIRSDIEKSRDMSIKDVRIADLIRSDIEKSRDISTKDARITELTRLLLENGVAVNAAGDDWVEEQSADVDIEMAMTIRTI